MTADITRGDLDYHQVNWRNMGSTDVLPQIWEQCGGEDSPPYWEG